MQFSQRGKLKLHGKLQNAGPVRSAGGAELGFTFPAEVPAGQLPTGRTTPQPHLVLAQPSHSGFHTATQKSDTLSVLEEFKTELNSTSSFISLSWSTVASFCWVLSKATIHSIAYVLPATELHRNAMHDSDIYLFVIYF